MDAVATIRTELLRALAEDADGRDKERVKLVRSLTGKCVTAGWAEDGAERCTRLHPDVRRLQSEADYTRALLGQLPDPRAGSLMHVAMKCESLLAALEE